MLYLVIPVFLIVGLTAFLMSPRGHLVLEVFKFYVLGKDSGFSFREIHLLWSVSKVAELENPSALFWSLTAFDKSIAAILRKFEEKGIKDSVKNQDFLSRLYAYRTKIEFDSPKYKRGLTSTREIEQGQLMCILVKGMGVYNTKVIQNSYQGIFAEFPVATSANAANPDWNGVIVSVYFWRRDDAGYVFDTVVSGQSFVKSKPAVCIKHSPELVRSQKRRSIRVQCSIPAVLYILKSGTDGKDEIPAHEGFSCLLEDLSEDGAAILVGGKGTKGLRVRLEFDIGENPIIMVGEIKGVDSIPKKQQSRLHFECKNLAPWMRNTILSYVYNVMPEGEREVFDAIRLSEEQSITDVEVSDNGRGEESPVENPPEKEEGIKDSRGNVVLPEEIIPENNQENSEKNLQNEGF